MLEGNALNPTKTHSVQFLPWQRIFNQLGEEIRKDLDLIEELKKKTGLPCHSMVDITRGMIPEEIADWMPLLSKAMTSVEFGDTVVKAMSDVKMNFF